MPKIQVSRNKELNEIFLKTIEADASVEYSLNENSIQFLMLEAIDEADISKVNKLFNLDNDQITSLEIPTGNPLFIELNASSKIIKCEYLDKERAKDLLVF